MTKMFVHRCFKRAFHQFLGELLEQSIFPNQIFRLLVISQQAVQQFVLTVITLLSPGRQFPAK